jgi:hypothetical protein
MVPSPEQVALRDDLDKTRRQATHMILRLLQHGKLNDFNDFNDNELKLLAGLVEIKQLIGLELTKYTRPYIQSARIAVPHPTHHVNTP